MLRIILRSSAKGAFQPYDAASIDSHLAATRPLSQSLSDYDYPISGSVVPVSTDGYGRFAQSPGSLPFPTVGPPPRPASFFAEVDHPSCLPADSLRRDLDFLSPLEDPEFMAESNSLAALGRSKSSTRYRSQRRPSNRDEFDGPHQLLELPSPQTVSSQAKELPHLPTSLDVTEQDCILNAVNDRLSQCAFDFVAKYQFPIPIEPDKRHVRVPSDREWTEWVYLLKRLATKRRIPARVLYNGQIKQLVTVLENSLEMRHAAKHQSRPIKDDRNVLQLVSAGTQVAKILKDASAMEYLDRLYVDTEQRIQEGRNRRVKFATP